MLNAARMIAPFRNGDPGDGERKRQSPCIL